MKFSEFKYKRPNYNKIKVTFEGIISDINLSTTYDEQKKHIDNLNILRNDTESMSTIASIRYSINTEDEFYSNEREYWDEHSPLFEELNSLLYKAIVNSPFKENIIKDYGIQFFKIIECSLKSFSSDIIEELQEENKLCSQYTKLLASAKINFEGKERNLSGLGSFILSKDRDMREKASKAYYGYFEENEDKFDEVFDKLVKLRQKIAIKLGYKNFVEVG
ncbi:MAG: M3 family oligoendopeptidase, partial [Peptostreptococcaceae bacterium]